MVYDIENTRSANHYAEVEVDGQMMVNIFKRDHTYIESRRCATYDEMTQYMEDVFERLEN